MAKFKPGIPDGFSLDVQPVRDLGDYLDEPSPLPQRKPRVQAPEVGEGNAAIPQVVAPTEALVETPSAAATTIAEPMPPPPAQERTRFIESRPIAVPREQVAVGPKPIVLREERIIHPGPISQPAREPAVNEDQFPKPKAPRREISMTPETLRMSDELLDVIRSGSGQRDTKANELFHALVLLVHEVKDEIDTHGIPKRGRWGSPTARAYPLELKNAFLRALLRKKGAEATA